MMSVRAVVLLFVFASTFLSVAEAKKKGTPLTGKLFSSTEHHFVHNPKIVAAWKKTITANKAAAKKASASRASKSKVHTASSVADTCPFIDNGMLGLGSPPLGLTVCQAGTCNCPTNSFCASYANPSVAGMGICVCGASLCDPVSGLQCVASTLSSGVMTYQCETSSTAPTPTPLPYMHSKLMRKLL